MKDENIDNARKVNELQKIQDDFTSRRLRLERNIKDLENEVSRLEKVQIAMTKE